VRAPGRVAKDGAVRFWPRNAGRERSGADTPEAAAPTATAEALVRRLRQGDASALEPLYRTESGPVYRYALALCGQPDWAADAMQEAFVAFAGRPEGWDPGRAPLGAYLAGMARHHLLARWRSRPVADDADAQPEDLVSSPEEQLVRAQDHARLWEALQRVPWNFREAVVLVDLQDRSYTEAAAIAGIELNTLRTRLHRGRARLLALLQDHAPAHATAPATPLP